MFEKPPTTPATIPIVRRAIDTRRWFVRSSRMAVAPRKATLASFARVNPGSPKSCATVRTSGFISARQTVTVGHDQEREVVESVRESQKQQRDDRQVAVPRSSPW